MLYTIFHFNKKPKNIYNIKDLMVLMKLEHFHYAATLFNEGKDLLNKKREKASTLQAKA